MSSIDPRLLPRLLLSLLTRPSKNPVASRPRTGWKLNRIAIVFPLLAVSTCRPRSRPKMPQNNIPTQKGPQSKIMPRLLEAHLPFPYFRVFSYQYGRRAAPCRGNRRAPTRTVKKRERRKRKEERRKHEERGKVLAFYLLSPPPLSLYAPHARTCTARREGATREKRRSRN